MAEEVIYNVLVVEDAHADQHLIQESFHDCEYKCVLVFAENIDQAKKRLAEIRIHLIILDIHLGIDDGLDLVKVVRADATIAATPIVVLSGMEGEVNRAYQAGVNAFLRKESDLYKFSSKIVSLMNFWVKTAELPTV